MSAVWIHTWSMYPTVSISYSLFHQISSQENRVIGSLLLNMLALVKMLSTRVQYLFDPARKVITYAILYTTVCTLIHVVGTYGVQQQHTYM